MLGVTGAVGEQLPHQPLAFLSPFFVQEPAQIRGPGQQADDVQRHPPGEGAVIDGRGGLDLVRREVSLQESVHRMIHARTRWRKRWAARMQVQWRRLGESDAGLPGHPLVDPRAEQADLLAGQLRAFDRHHIVRVEPGDQFDEMTLGALALDGHWAGIAAPDKGLARVELETALGLAAAVALDATGFKNRFDVTDKIDSFGRGRGQFLKLFGREPGRDGDCGAPQPGEKNDSLLHHNNSYDTNPGRIQIANRQSPPRSLP